MKTYVLLGTFSELTSLLRVTISLVGMTDLETSFSSNPVIFIFCLVNVSNLLTCSKNFPNFLQLYLIGAKDVKGAYKDIMLIRPSLSDGKDANNIGKGTYIKAASIGSICIRDTYANKYTSAGNASFARSAGAIKHSKIYLQSFSISQVELLGINWWLLPLLQILYWLMSIPINDLLNNVIIGAADAGTTSGINAVKGLVIHL